MKIKSVLTYLAIMMGSMFLSISAFATTATCVQMDLASEATNSSLVCCAKKIVPVENKTCIDIDQNAACASAGDTAARDCPFYGVHK